ncbi:MAG: hypothetical protein ABI806_27360 [Candidatus Solibacter sp.]
MASATQDELYRKFLEAAGQQSYENADTKAMLADVIAQFQEVKSQLPGTSTAAQTQASKATDTSGSSGGSLASTILKSGFGLAPLVAGLVGLFKGSEDDAPPALVKYAMPGSIQFQAAESSSRMTALDYDQMGLARSYPVQRAAESQQAPQSTTGQQITVNVQAMDARSFLDRSNDIALAVRDAMLNLNAINDVVNEL